MSVIDFLPRYQAYRRGVVGGSIVVFLVYLVLFPLAVIAVFSFFASDTTFFAQFTLRNWVVSLTSVRQVLVNTVIYSLGSTLLTTFLGLTIGWAIAKTNMPMRRVFFFTMFIIFFIPPVALEDAYVNIFGNNGLIANVLNISINMYSMEGMVFVQGIRLVPFALILIIPLYQNIDPALEEAGKISGAGTIKILKDIVIPLVTPGTLVVFVITFAIALGSFRVPIVLGLPGSVIVLPTAIYRAIQFQPVAYGQAMSLSAILVVISIPLLYFYKLGTGASDKYQTVGGDRSQTRIVDLGGYRYLVSFLIGLYMLIAILLPAMLLIYKSLIPFYIPPTTGQIPPISLEGYINIFAMPRIVGALMNTLIISISGIVILFGLAVFISWVIEKSDIAFKSTIDYISFLPIGLPSVVLAVGLLIMYTSIVPIDIYGTLTIFVVGFVIRYLPSTIRVVQPAVTQIHSDLLKAGKISGATTPRRIRTIIFPLIKPSLQTAGPMMFALLFYELPIVLMLSTPGNKTVSVVLLELYGEGQTQTMSALGVIMMIGLLAIAIIINRLPHNS